MNVVHLPELSSHVFTLSVLCMWRIACIYTHIYMCIYMYIYLYICDLYVCDLIFSLFDSYSHTLVCYMLLYSY